MSLKKYGLLIFLGVILGSSIAYTIHLFSMKMNTSRNIASEKMAHLNKRGPVGKVGAPLFVQVSALPESNPDSGYYRLLAHITFNQPISGLKFQWALPLEARLISGSTDGDINLGAGEDSAEEIIELQLTDTHKDSQLLFDLSYSQNGFPLGTSDLFVFKATTIY